MTKQELIDFDKAVKKAFEEGFDEGRREGYTYGFEIGSGQQQKLVGAVV